MKYFLSVLMFSVSLPVSAFAAKEVPQERGFEIQTKLVYEAPGRGSVVRAAKVMSLAETNSGWVPLTESKKGVILLARKVSESLDEIEMEYLVVDTRKNASVFFTPKLKTRLGQEARVTIDGAKEAVTISILAKRAAIKPGGDGEQ